MEKIYRIAWTLLVVSVVINAMVFFIAPSYICIEGVCPQELIEVSGDNIYDINEAKSILSSTQSGAVSGSTPSTPSGFWDTIAGTVIGGGSSSGLINTVLIPFISLVFPMQVLSLYYANLLDISILKNIIYFFASIFSIIQLIGLTYFIIYIAGLVRGVRA